MTDIRTYIRPFMAASGWLVLCVLIVLAFTNEMTVPQWMIGILLSPGAVWLTSRTIEKVKEVKK